MTGASEGAAWRRLAGPLFTFRAIGQILEFVGWVILARRLGARPFGTLSIAFLLARYMGLIADWGASIAGPRNVASDDTVMSRTRVTVRLRARLAAGLSAAFVVVCTITGNVLMIPVSAVILMLGLSRDWIAIGRHQGVRAALPLTVQGMVISVLALAASEKTPAIAVGCGYASAATVSILINRLPSGQINKGGRDSLSPWMLGAVMFNQILSSADILILATFSTAAVTGVYSAVYRIPNGWLAGVSILSSALLPIATRTVGNESSWRGLIRNSLRVSAASGAILLLATPLIYMLTPYVFGDEFKEGRIPVVILIFATALATTGAPLHQFYLVIGRDQIYTLFLGFSALIIVLISVVLVPLFSMIGAACATLFAHAALVACLYVAVRRRTGTLAPSLD